MAELIPVGGCDDEHRVGDVIFVHGLNGNAVEYWCSGGKLENYWPRWLSQDLPGVGVWSLKYDNAAFAVQGFALPLEERALNVLLIFMNTKIGGRPIVFVAHSMGGLLVKQILRTAYDSRHIRARKDIL